MGQAGPTFNNRARSRSNSKIAIIGGGSIHCAGFIQSIINQPDVLSGCTIVLMDIDETNLMLVYTLSQRLFQRAGIDITLEMTTSQEEALDSADFVLTTFRVGGTKARILDEKIPLEYGLVGHDIVGPGGFFYALRTAPVIAGIAAEMEKIAPKAFLLNYTIPCNIVIEAIAHSSGIRVIGLDDWPIPGVRYQAGLAGQPVDKLHPRKVGISHANWTTRLWREGDDILPQIVEWCKEYIQTHQELTESNYEQVLLARLTAYYEAIPSRYLYYYYFPDIVFEFQSKRTMTPGERLLHDLPDIIEQYEREVHKIEPDPSYTEKGLHIGNVALSVIRSILDDSGDEWVLSVPNNGAIKFLADDRVVELPCRVDARGASPLAQGDGGLSLEQRGLIAALAEYEGATARVALWGNRKEAIKALTANPLVMSYNKAEKLYYRMAQAHRDYLPERLLT
jgi:6-phospho-beta-glucosidase